MLQSLKYFVRKLDDWIYESWGPIRVLFPVSNIYGFACQQPILEALSAVPGFRVATTKEHSSIQLVFSTLDMQQSFEKHYIPVSRARWNKWHYVIHTDTSELHLPRGGVRVNITHGSAFGCSDYVYEQVNRPNIDLVFGLSRAERTYHEIRNPDIFVRQAFIPMGFPKLDCLIRGEYSREDTLVELRLSVEKETILITSHWTLPSLLRSFRGEILDSLSTLTDRYNIILTGHPKLWENPDTDSFIMPGARMERFNSQSLWSELQSYAIANNNITVVHSNNIHHLLNAADLLITDASSVMVEYCTLNRPILFFDNPQCKFSDSKTYQLYRGAGQVFNNLDGLAAICERILVEGDDKASGRMRMREYFLANPGCAGAVARELLETMGRVTGSGSTRWKKVKELEAICNN